MTDDLNDQCGNKREEGTTPSFSHRIIKVERENLEHWQHNATQRLSIRAPWMQSAVLRFVNGGGTGKRVKACSKLRKPSQCRSTSVGKIGIKMKVVVHGYSSGGREECSRMQLNTQQA